MDKKNLYDIVPELSEKEEKKTAKKKQKRMSRKQKRALIISIISAALVSVLALGIIIGIPIYKDLTKVILAPEDMPMLYITSEPALKYANSENGDAVLLSSALYDRTTLSPYSIHEVTADGKTVYFLDFMGDLYRKNLDTNTENRFIAEEVKSFNISENGELIFLLNDGTLKSCKFSSDRDTFKLKDLDSGVSEFWCSKNGKYLLYTKKTESATEFYSKSLGLFGKVRHLGNDLGEIVKTFGEDMDIVYLLKTSDGDKKTVNIIENLSSVKTAVSAADEIYSYGADGSLLYGMKTGMGVDLSIFFTDKLNESDKQLEAPDFEKYLYGEISKTEFEKLQKTYAEKLGRDAIRDMIKEESDKTSNITLYKYEDGRQNKIEDNINTVIDFKEDNSTVIYTSAKYKTAGDTRGDISEFESAEAAYNQIVSLLAEGSLQYKAYIKGIDSLKTIYHREKEMTKVYMREDATGVYIYQKNLAEEKATLKYIDIALGNIGAPKEISADLSEEPVEYKGKFLINEKQSLKGEGEETEVISSSILSGINKTQIDNNVLLSSLRENSKGELLYLKDAKEGKGTLIMKALAAETTEPTYNVLEEAGEVVFAEFRGGTVYYMTEFGRGYVLTQYKGVSDNIDEEVLNIAFYE